MSPGMEEPAPSIPVGPKWGLKILAAFLGAQMVVAVVVGVLAGRGKLGAPGGIVAAPGKAMPAVDLRVALGAALAGTLLAGVVALLMVRRTFARPGGAGARVAVGWRAASTRACLRAALQGLGIVAAFVVVGVVLPGPRHGLGSLASAASAGGWARAAWAVLAIGLAPPIEELVFRGVLYAGFAQRWSPRVAGTISVALFVSLHVAEIAAYVPAWLAIAAVGALALRARVVTGSLAPAIALHASYNLGLVLLVCAT
jgi:membrane protease YdiL (CAAX protease family)